MIDMKILHENCDLEKDNNTQLPNNAYVVKYLIDGTEHFDIAMSQKKVEIFDAYYDKYRKDLISIIQSKGVVSPKLWNIQPKEKK